MDIHFEICYLLLNIIKLFVFLNINFKWVLLGDKGNNTGKIQKMSMNYTFKKNLIW